MIFLLLLVSLTPFKSYKLVLVSDLTSPHWCYTCSGPKNSLHSHAATCARQSEMNCNFPLKNTPAELFLLHFRSRAQPFIPNLPYWLNGAIITAMESSPQRGLRGHSAQPRLIYWPLTAVWSKQYQSASMNHVSWKPPLLTMSCNFGVIYRR